MLQSLTIRPTLPVMAGDVRHDAQPEPEPVADVLAFANCGKLVSATIEVYFRPTSNDAQLHRSLADRSPDYTFKCSLAELKKLRSQVEKSVGRGSHCALCKRVATYMEYCWERPRLLSPSWHGGMMLQPEALTGFLNQLLRFASQLGADGHTDFVAIVGVFLQSRQHV